MPMKHVFQPENLNLKGNLRLRLTEKAQSSGITVGSPIVAPSLALTLAKLKMNIELLSVHRWRSLDSVQVY
ncbi:hypothetical protein L1987_33285 [Smallanthus sonchifolius]|uniref:Uncharacterized protein n=1 Tax=Smallanthus sonchifolius TaxID=185202 RepID=A0ACB9HQN8_9ASTR|nr:hypothetical protein L1987_33285 [Smallanthus sonchifolius]